MAAIVIDCGSGFTKAGFAGDDLPHCVIPSVVATPKCGDQCSYVGSEAQAKRGVLELQFPVQRGIVTDWERIEVLWRHTFDHELHANPTEHAVLLTDSPSSSKADRERAAQILFESFNVPAIFVQTTAVLALYAAGRNTGCVFESGDGVSHAVPIYEGYAQPHTVKRLDLAGHDVTRYLTSLLPDAVSAKDEVALNVKETLCYVAADYDEQLKISESSSTLQRAFELPDGHVITVDTERFRAPEALFRPNLTGEHKDADGIHRLTHDCIQECDVDIRNDLFANLYLSGGNTLFSGLADRLSAELTKLAPAGTKLVVKAPSDRQHSAWIGGTILASICSFPDIWISKDEYADCGSAVVRRKCG